MIQQLFAPRSQLSDVLGGEIYATDQRKTHRLPSLLAHPSDELPQETLAERFVRHERRDAQLVRSIFHQRLAQRFLCCSQRLRNGLVISLVWGRVGGARARQEEVGTEVL